MINYHKTKGELRIQLTIAINCMSFEDSIKMCTMHSKSDNI